MRTAAPASTAAEHRRPRVGTGVVALLQTLDADASPDGLVTVSVRQLAGRLGTRTRTVAGGLATLVRAGALTALGGGAYALAGTAAEGSAAVDTALRAGHRAPRHRRAAS